MCMRARINGWEEVVSWLISEKLEVEWNVENTELNQGESFKVIESKEFWMIVIVWQTRL